MLRHAYVCYESVRLVDVRLLCVFFGHACQQTNVCLFVYVICREEGRFAQLTKLSVHIPENWEQKAAVEICEATGVVGSQVRNYGTATG